MGIYLFFILFLLYYKECSVVVTLICRGTSKKRFMMLIHDLVKKHDVGLLVLMETHSNGNRAEGITRSFKFDKHFIKDVEGGSRGDLVSLE